jgi:5,10-methylenetetrahydrofolate reductase
LLRALSLLNTGQDLAGQAIEGPSPDFIYGAAAALTANPVLPAVLKFNKKVRCQPNFFMSHPIFDLAGVEGFFKEAGEVQTPLLASVCVLTEEQVREYNPGRFPGLIIPAPILDKMRSWKAEEFPSRMVEFTAGLIAAIKKDKRFRGVHLMLQGQEERIGDIL